VGRGYVPRVTVGPLADPVTVQEHLALLAFLRGHEHREGMRHHR
jgi:hypothetical protein